MEWGQNKGKVWTCLWGSESGAEQKERRLAQPPLAVLPTQKQDVG